MAVIANTDVSVLKMIEQDILSQRPVSEQPEINSSKVCEADSRGEIEFTD